MHYKNMICTNFCSKSDAKINNVCYTLIPVSGILCPPSLPPPPPPPPPPTPPPPPPSSQMSTPSNDRKMSVKRINWDKLDQTKVGNTIWEQVIYS